MPTKADYEAAFEKECRNEYPAIDAFEREYGYFVPRLQMEAAARILACPVKKNHPCWQHGRVVYAVCRKYLADHAGQVVQFVDIGTAKGFSALMMAWAARDSGVQKVRIASCDVLDTTVPMYRNSILDCEGPRTLAEYLEPWPEAKNIGFWTLPGVDFLKRRTTPYGTFRVHLAFVDGKHSTEAVAEEARLLSGLQMPGDIILFDDLQMLPVRKAVGKVTGYDMRLIQAADDRAYMLATKC